MTDHIGLAQTYLAADVGGRGNLVFGIEAHRLRLAQVNAIKANNKIQMPPVATHLAVGDRLQTNRCLPRYGVANALILDMLQLRRRQSLIFEVGASLPQRTGAQQATDMVGAKRRQFCLRDGCHCASPIGISACLRHHTDEGHAVSPPRRIIRIPFAPHSHPLQSVEASARIHYF